MAIVSTQLTFAGTVDTFPEADLRAALRAQFAQGPPGLFQGRSLFSDFDAQREPKGVPKWSQNQQKNSPKINATIDVIFEGPLKRCWLALGVFLGPWTLENECLV